MRWRDSVDGCGSSWPFQFDRCFVYLYAGWVRGRGHGRAILSFWQNINH